MLADPHLTVPHYVPNSDELFPGTNINGGIAVTYRDEDRDGEPIGTFTQYPELNTILHKVVESGTAVTGASWYHQFALLPLHGQVVRGPPRRARAEAQGQRALVKTNAFDQFSNLFHESKPEDGHDYVQVLGLSEPRSGLPVDSQRLLRRPGEPLEVQGRASEVARAPWNAWQRARLGHRGTADRRARSGNDPDLHHHRRVRR